MKILLKKLLVKLYFLYWVLRFLRYSNSPFLCIITPVFDDASEPLKKLILDLKAQNYGDFIHVSISNGESPKIKKTLEQIRKTDHRFKYVELKKESDKGIHLQKNLSKRKNYCMKQFTADRYLIIDADSAIINRHAIAVLFIAHIFTRRDIIVFNIVHEIGILPIFPVDIGRIDITNFSFSYRIANGKNYPEKPPTRKYRELFYKATDYFFFLDIHNKKNTLFLPFTYLHKDKRKSYKTVFELMK